MEQTQSNQPAKHAIHAIITTQDGSAAHVYGKTQKELNEALSSFTDYKVLCVIKGKQMQAKEHKALLLS